jgi:NAD(P)-dependent dehydrogenase (short-subunit alcohol dehydrogenase family)
MNLELINKTALISGSTKGIGLAIASQLASEGARVIVNGRSDKAVHSALEQIRKQVPEAKVEGFGGDLKPDLNRIAEPAAPFRLLTRNTPISPLGSGTSMVSKRASLACSICGIGLALR